MCSISLYNCRASTTSHRFEICWCLRRFLCFCVNRIPYNRAHCPEHRAVFYGIQIVPLPQIFLKVGYISAMVLLFWLKVLFYGPVLTGGGHL